MKMRDNLQMEEQTLNATMRKFGAPETCIRGYQHWSVLLRGSQVTLGSVILAAHGPATAWSSLSPEAFTELHRVVADLERVLKAAFAYEKLNYLMLMMVDPNVHFHVIPRYSVPRTFEGHVFVDAGWPGPPDLSRPNDTGAEMNGRILEHLRACWSEA
jgi:diadenosine tetraphosphate (Ap4A) HIT family hydrolase